VPEPQPLQSAARIGLEDRVAVVIPARLASQRLPRKVLADIAGRPLLSWTAAMAGRSCAGPSNVFVATGDAAVEQAALGEGLQVLRTPVDLPSGTARVAWASRLLPEDVRWVINVQADEPLLDPAAIDAVVRVLADGRWDMATTVCAIAVDEWRSGEVVKAVVDRCGEARWFTRAPVPHRLIDLDDGRLEDALQGLPEVRRHLGVYGFDRSSLLRWGEAGGTAVAALAGLEQLGALSAGWRIGAAFVDRPSGPAVDTPGDLLAVRRALRDVNSMT